MENYTHTYSTEQYTADYFIEKFSAIRAEDFITGKYNDGTKKHDTLGHCGVKDNYSEEAFALKKLFKEKLGLEVVAVGDYSNGTTKYNQSEQKDRILAALADIKAKQL